MIKREFDRYQLHIPVLLQARHAPKGPVQCEGTLREISVAGLSMAFEGVDPRSLGSVVEGRIVILSKSGDPPIEESFAVVWKRVDRPGELLLGVHLDCTHQEIVTRRDTHEKVKVWL